MTDNPAIPPETQAALTEFAKTEGLDVLPVRPGGGGAHRRPASPPDVATTVTAEYVDAEVYGLKIALGAVAVFALLALWFTRRLPGKPLGQPRRHSGRPARRAPAAA